VILGSPGPSLEAAKKLAAEDPAVKAKVLNAEVRAWLIAVEGERAPSSKKKR
jgi:hypothetical protein